MKQYERYNFKRYRRIGCEYWVLMSTNISDMNKIDLISSDWYGVYVIYLKYKESYIGGSCDGIGIRSRLFSHTHETWHKNIIERIDIFVTDIKYAMQLEKMLIKTFKPELNTMMYESCSVDGNVIHENVVMSDKILTCADINFEGRHMLQLPTVDNVSGIVIKPVMYRNFDGSFKPVVQVKNKKLLSGNKAMNLLIVKLENDETEYVIPYDSTLHYSFIRIVESNRWEYEDIFGKWFKVTSKMARKYGNYYLEYNAVCHSNIRKTAEEF